MNSPIKLIKLKNYWLWFWKGFIGCYIWYICALNSNFTTYLPHMCITTILYFYFLYFFIFFEIIKSICWVLELPPIMFCTFSLVLMGFGTLDIFIRLVFWGDKLFHLFSFESENEIYIHSLIFIDKRNW